MGKFWLIVVTTTTMLSALVVGGCAKARDSAAPVVSVSSEPAAQALASDPPYAYTLIIGTYYPSQGHVHLAESDTAEFAYNSDPPTSGPHRDLYSDVFDSPAPLPKDVQVNLLEHADVLVQYNCKCPIIADLLHQIAYRYDRDWIRPDRRDPLRADAQDAEFDGSAVIVAPYPGMSHEIALSAWGRLGTLDAFDQVKIDDFIHAYLHNISNTEP